MQDSRFFYPDVGGEAGEFIEEVRGETWECPMCGYDIVIGGMSGYEHDGGLEGGDGTKWWLYLECPDYGYKDSYRDVKARTIGFEQD
jgi:predicted RNA-binding Zn-ribbon protein involved in translation (DUF1610 family)